MPSMLVKKINRAIKGDRAGRLLRRRLAELGYDTYRQTLDNHLDGKALEPPKAALLMALLDVAIKYGGIRLENYIEMVKADVRYD